MHSHSCMHEKSKIKIKGRSGFVVILFCTGFGRTGGLVVILPPGGGDIGVNQLYSSRCYHLLTRWDHKATYDADSLHWRTNSSCYRWQS